MVSGGSWVSWQQQELAAVQLHSGGAINRNAEDRRKRKGKGNGKGKGKGKGTRGLSRSQRGERSRSQDRVMNVEVKICVAVLRIAFRPIQITGGQH